MHAAYMACQASLGCSVCAISGVSPDDMPCVAGMELEGNYTEVTSANAAVSISPPQVLAPSGSEESIVFEVVDFSPEWDFASGGAKLILTGGITNDTDADNARIRPLYLKFDETEVRFHTRDPGCQ